MTATTVKNWSEWLKSSRFSYMSEEQKEQTFRWLSLVKDKIIDRSNLKPDDTLLDIGTGTGLLAFGAYDFLRQHGKVIASDYVEDCIQECKKIIDSIEPQNKMEFLLSNASNIDLPENSVDVTVMRSVMVHILEKQPVLDECYRVLKPGGRISIFEPIINSNTRNSELINPDNCPDFEKYKEVESIIMTMPNDSLMNFDEKTLQDNFVKAGFKKIKVDLCTEKSVYKATAAMIDPWFNTPPNPGGMTLKQRFLNYFSEEEIEKYIAVIKADLDEKMITVKSNSVYISAEK